MVLEWLSYNHPIYISGMPVTLRTECPKDDLFLFDLYSSTRLDELAVLDWTASQQEMFLKMQSNARRQYYKTKFPDAHGQIVLLNDHPIGRIMVMRWDDEIRLLDIALLPEYRNAGIGTALIRKIIDEANETGKPVRLHVQRFSRAVRLYERLGFARISDTGTYFVMEWSPGVA
jgi:GNAT superfamily N-acetyltransferase